MFLELGWYAHRPLHRLMFRGVFERHPCLKFVMTEQGNWWVPGRSPTSIGWSSACSASPARRRAIRWRDRGGLSLKPSGYWERQCYLGASFMGPHDCAVREDTGVDRIMWGSDYPHYEGTHPYTNEALRYTFAGVDSDEVRLMLGTNVARAVRVRSRRAVPARR